MELQNIRGEFKTIYTSSGNISSQSEDAEDIIGSVTMEYNDWDKRRPSKAILKEQNNQTKNNGYNAQGGRGAPSLPAQSIRICVFVSFPPSLCFWFL